jgi:nuclear pore complex protein Nup155
MQQGPRMYMSTPYTNSRPASSVQMSLIQQTQQQNMTCEYRYCTFLTPFPDFLLFPAPIFGSQTMDLAQANFNYSAKHKGLYIHLSRILRPIWRRHCVDGNLKSTISLSVCTSIVEDLFAIKRFLENSKYSNFGQTSMHSMHQSGWVIL